MSYWIDLEAWCFCLGIWVFDIHLILKISVNALEIFSVRINMCDSPIGKMVNEIFIRTKKNLNNKDWSDLKIKIASR